jgi:triphosphatase
MSIEREIKLALPTEQVDAAIQWFAELAGRTGRAITLENLYFDTPALTLARSKSALRLRRTPEGWLQTYKTVGTAKSGLHNRHEWEMPVAGQKLEIDALLQACDDADAAAALQRAAPQLAGLFRTNFTRTLWLISRDDAEIEAAVDQGEIVASVHGETRRTPICEIELELKRGDDAALHALATELSASVSGLAPDDISKAQRGYRLREDAAGAR